jgi:hypothetical protein
MPRRLCRRIAFAALVASAPPLLGGAASAGDRDKAAAEIFRTGSKAYARGEYRAAALAFEAAFREAPHAAAAYNAARAWERVSEPARAADMYEAARAIAGLSDDEVTDATARLAALATTLGMVDITTPGLVTVAHVARVRAPRRVHVTPGDYEVELELPDGRIDRRRVHVAAGGSVRVEIAQPPPTAAPEPAAATVRPANTSTGRSERQEHASTSPVAVAGWVTLAGSAAVAGVSIALGVMALDARDEFDAKKWADQDLHDRAATLRTWTNVGWVATGVLAAVGITLLVVRAASPDGSPRNGSSLRLGARGASFSTQF